MTEFNSRTALIAAIINNTLRYEGDKLCLSDYVIGTRATLMYYANDYLDRTESRNSLRLYSTNGYVFFELLVTNLSDLGEWDLPKLPVSVREKYQRLEPAISFNTAHDEPIAALFETIGTAPPPVWRPRQITRITCREPFVDLTLDGHSTLSEIAERVPLVSGTIPNGPASVIIKHRTIMEKADEPS